MKYFYILWAWIWRRPVRTVLTSFTIVVTFLLFGLLEGLNAGMDRVISSFHADRLNVLNRISMLNPQPLTNLEAIRKLDGVRDITTWTFFGGFFRVASNQVTVIATDPASMFRLYSEVKVPASQVQAMEKLRTGAIVGNRLAEKYGWKVGDRVPIQTPVWARKDGEKGWQFDIVGIYEVEGPSQVQSNLFFINYSYFNEERISLKNTVHIFLVGLNGPELAETLSRRIDAMFANSAFATRTQSEQVYARNQMNQLADIKLITHSILGATLFTLLFVVMNTLMQSVSERLPEFAVMKTVGFSDSHIFVLVLVETAFICLVSAVVGLGLAAWLYPKLGNTPFTAQFAMSAGLSPLPVVMGLVTAILIAFISGLMPALRAKNLSIVEALSGK